MGLLAAPIDWIFQFQGRPQSVITKSEYMRRARVIAQRAKQVVVRGRACLGDRVEGLRRRWAGSANCAPAVVH